MTKISKSALTVYKTVEGMLAPVDAGVIVSVLEHQVEAGVSGSLAEFGTYKGRCAALIASYVQENENLFLVDVADYLEQEKIAQITPRFSFHKMDSKSFADTGVDKKIHGTFRFIHADGSHTFNNVYYDLRNADMLLSHDGVLVVDDYYNPHYPQVAAAIFTYLAKEETDLSVMLVGSNKCYICRKSYAETFTSFVKNHLQDYMETFGTPIQLSKTDRHASMDCISFKSMPSGSNEKVYGPKLYGHFFGVTA